MHWWEQMLRRTRAERQLDMELRDHIDRHIAHLMAQGLDEAEARRRALLTFGGVEQIKEECRDVRGTRGLETTMQDVRYACRGLVALPAFTVVIVLSLALGIGANTAAYTLLHAALLRALPVSQASQLVEFTTYDATVDGTDHFSYPLYTSYREALRAHADVAAVFPQRLQRISVDGGGRGGDTTAIERAVVEGASANYFSMLGVTPSEGRLFVEGDDNVTGGQAIAVISDAYRERRFGGRTERDGAGNVLAPVEGRRLIIDDMPYIIVGVAAKGFDGVEAQAKTDIWIPVTAALPPKWVTNYGSKVLRMIARMRPDADLTQAAAMTDLIYRR